MYEKVRNTDSFLFNFVWTLHEFGLNSPFESLKWPQSVTKEYAFISGSMVSQDMYIQKYLKAYNPSLVLSVRKVFLLWETVDPRVFRWNFFPLTLTIFFLTSRQRQQIRTFPTSRFSVQNGKFRLHNKAIDSTPSIFVRVLAPQFQMIRLINNQKYFGLCEILQISASKILVTCM